MGFNPYVSPSTMCSPRFSCSLDEPVLSLCREEDYHLMVMLSPQGGPYPTLVALSNCFGGDVSQSIHTSVYS